MPPLPEESSEIIIDGSGMRHQELCNRLREATSEMTVRLERVETHAGLASGLTTEAALKIAGDVGDFAMLMADGVNAEIAGNAASSCGHSLVSGRILIKGRAGDYLGAFASGGFIIVHGQAKNRCGFDLCGAEIFVRGNVGDEAGCNMSSGVLVLGNGAGDNLGAGMTGGMIYIRGDVKSKSNDVRPVRMKDADAMRLSLLLVRAGVKGGGDGFKAYAPKSIKA